MCFWRRQFGVLNNAVLHNDKYMQAYIQKCTFSLKRSRESSKKIFNSCLAFFICYEGHNDTEIDDHFLCSFFFFFPQ